MKVRNLHSALILLLLAFFLMALLALRSFMTANRIVATADLAGQKSNTSYVVPMDTPVGNQNYQI